MFKRFVGAAACAAAALLALSAGSVAWANNAPAENFIGDRLGTVAVSPSGQYVAILEPTGPDTSQLSIATYQDGKLGQRSVLNLGKTQAIDVAFKSDDRLLITVLQEGIKVGDFKTKDHADLTTDRTLVISFKRDGSDAKILLNTADAGFGTHVQALLPNDPDNVLLSNVQIRLFSTSLFKVNVNTGESERVEESYASHSYGYETNSDGYAYIRYDLDPMRGEMVVRSRPVGGRWNTIKTYPVIDGVPTYEFAGMASPTTAYAFDQRAQDRRSIWEYDLETGKPLKLVMSDPTADAVGVLNNPYKGAMTGTLFVHNGRAHATYTSKALAAAQAALDESFTQYPINEIVDYSKDMGLLVVRSEGPLQPSVYTLFDARRMEAVPVMSTDSASANRLGTTQTITYPSSDGKPIVAFLTIPAGGARNLPLVVMPHGGPDAQDTLGYDGWRAFLVSRGYAVLQPEFRGSDGYGAAFTAAGRGAWGTDVQADARAGVLKVEKDGIADPKRVCIFGWSYGGYMALAGAAFSPDLYKCAISGAGPSDINAILDWEGKQTGSDSPVHQFWEARMGDSKTRDKESPALHVDGIMAPILLIHGEKDTTVPIEQSEIMEKALKAAGKDVKFIRVPDERHSFHNHQQADMLRSVESFLAANIGH